MDEWIPRRAEPDSQESDEQVEAALLQLRGLLAREGGAICLTQKMHLHSLR